MKKEIQLGDFTYQLVKEYKDGFQVEDILNKYTDYFQEFDYIFGDYSYDKLRLKGFCKKGSSNYRKINSIDMLDDYIKDYCAYECRYFLLEKVSNKNEKTGENG